MSLLSSEDFKRDETGDTVGVLSSREQRLRREKVLKKPETEAVARPRKQRPHAEKIMLSAMQADISTSERKRSYESSEGDSTEFKKQFRFKTNEGKPDMRSSKKSPKPGVPIVPNAVPPDLPEEYKNRIKAMNGTKVVMVIQKALTNTDLQKGQNRLSMPFGQINIFLREDEREYLSQQQAMEVPFVEPSHEFSKMVLRQWDMRKDSGKTSSTYALRTHWFAVAEKYDLKKEDVVQIWSFRVGNEEQLCLALVVVSRKGDHGSNGSKSNDNAVGSSSRGREGSGCKSVVEDASTRPSVKEGVRGGGGSGCGCLRIRRKLKPKWRWLLLWLGEN